MHGNLTGLGALFADAGHELYLVGGSVRDALLGRESNDLDFTTSARPEQTQAILRPWADDLWDTGIEYGTVCARRGDDQVEITTFRAERYDRVSRKPQVTFGDNLVDDLRRRDFTVNAMAIDAHLGRYGEVNDPLGGLEDLRSKVLDTPASPEESFGDDPLRMLRAARFVSQLGFVVAPRVRSAIISMAPQLLRVSTERVIVELDKLISGEFPDAGIAFLQQTGLARIVLPGVEPQSLRWIIDQEDGEVDLDLRWAALLQGSDPAETRIRLRGLKYSTKRVNAIHGLVRLHQAFYERGPWNDAAIRRWIDEAGELLRRVHQLVRADDPQFDLETLEKRIGHIFLDDFRRAQPRLSGGEIMALLTIPAGPKVGEATRYLNELRFERGPLTKADAAAELVKWYYG